MPWCPDCEREYYRQCRTCFRVDSAVIMDDGSLLATRDEINRLNKEAADRVTSGLKESDGEAVASSR